MGEKFDLIDFVIVTLDSTTIEANIDEYRRLKYKQLIYIENLIKKNRVNQKEKKKYLEKIKKILLLNDNLVDLVEEIHNKLNKHCR